jgi:hypothetical protein
MAGYFLLRAGLALGGGISCPPETPLPDATPEASSDNELELEEAMSDDELELNDEDAAEALGDLRSEDKEPDDDTPDGSNDSELEEALEFGDKLTLGKLCMTSELELVAEELENEENELELGIGCFLPM